MPVVKSRASAQQMRSAANVTENEIRQLSIVGNRLGRMGMQSEAALIDSIASKLRNSEDPSPKSMLIGAYRKARGMV